MFLAVVLLTGSPAVQSAQAKPPESRFEKMSACPGVSPVWIDRYGSGIGLASETARARSVQGRVLWVDATANIDRYNSPDKIDRLLDHVSDSGFNTVVFDVKPISGQTVYPSRFSPKLEEWRGQRLPKEFDPVGTMVQSAHAHRLSLILSMNAFSEGHRLFKVGPGYAHPEHQSVLYVPKAFVQIGAHRFPLNWATGVSSKDAVTAGAHSEPGSEASVAVGAHWSVVGDAAGGTAAPDRMVRTLSGSGAAARFLRQAQIGDAVRFDTEASFVPIGDEVGGQIPLMMNPNDPAVQDQALRAIQEVVQRYRPDGVIYDDRLRYAGIDGDFSPESEQQFEQLVGQRLQWPDDVYKFVVTPTVGKGIRPGPFFDRWLAWRAENVRKYVKRVRETVSTANRSTRFGAYVGSWYGDYAALGHNYASPEAQAGFWFDTPDYAAAGTAPLLDYLMVGCYYPTATIYDAMQFGTGTGYCVEAAGALCNRLARDQTWTYAGIDCGAYKDDPEGLTRLIQAACCSTQGVMVFDLSHGVDALWGTFKQAFSQRMQAPHSVPGLLNDVRAHRKLVDGFHQRERPIIILNGSSGIGQ